MAPWYKGDFRDVDSFERDKGQYDVVIIVTSINDELVREAVKAPPQTRKTRYVVVVHNPDTLTYAFPVWSSAMLDHNMQPPLIQLLTIAPSVSAYTKSFVETWATSVGIRKTAHVPWISPLAPVKLPPPSRLRHLCLQVGCPQRHC